MVASRDPRPDPPISGRGGGYVKFVPKYQKARATIRGCNRGPLYGWSHGWPLSGRRRWIGWALNLAQCLLRVGGVHIFEVVGNALWLLRWWQYRAFDLTLRGALVLVEEIGEEDTHGVRRLDACLHTKFDRGSGS